MGDNGFRGGEVTARLWWLREWMGGEEVEIEM